MKKVKAVLTATAVCHRWSKENTSSPITVAYVMYEDGVVEKMGLSNTRTVNESVTVDWPFTLSEAKVLLEAKSKGLL